MKILIPIAVVSLWLASGVPAAETNEPTTVTVTRNRVNLRARPSLESEVVAQVDEGTPLSARALGESWAEVVPPAGIDFYVHRDFVKDGLVQATPLNVRAGAGVNFSTVGSLRKGDRVDVRGEFGEWIKIAPPPGASLWISREFVKSDEPPAPPPAVTETGAVAGAVAPVPAPAAPSAAPAVPELRPVMQTSGFEPGDGEKLQPPPGLELASGVAQGVRVQREGRLKTAGLIFRKPTKFQLVSEGDRPAVVCFVHGNEAQLDGLTGRLMQIRGREYRLADGAQPVVVLEQIRLLPTVQP